jgi:glycosyl transferase, family 25
MNVFVIHVKDAEARMQHMESQLAKVNLTAVYILDGDKHELNNSIISKYFIGKMAEVSNRTSCAYKHYLAYERMVEAQIPYAVILEDDIFLNNDFDTAVLNCIKEVKEKNLQNYLISLEETSLRYVKGSIRKRGRLLYPNTRGRMAGAYIVDLQAAKNMLQDVYRNKTDLTIDWYHNYCVTKGIINMLWIHPTIAIQGSINGMINSSISSRRTNYLRISSFYLQRAYKKILWRLR